MRKNGYTVFLLALLLGLQASAQTFVQRKGAQLVWDGKPYYYIGANYWYGSVLGLEKDPQKGRERLRNELDFLCSKGITNLRVLAATEGEGQVNGVMRVGPPLQTAKGKFNTAVLAGLDLLLSEMDKRNMKAVLFLSNNWEWSGGFLQYLRWNNLVADSIFRRKLSWDEQRDITSRFYTCDECKKDYLRQVAVLLDRTNTVNGKKYIEEPSIMAWELANEPRPMRPAAAEAYAQWISDAAAFIKSKDKNHLVTTGHEGEMGTESMPLFTKVHSDRNIDYLTIHIWPKNWGWFKDTSIQKDWDAMAGKTSDYIQRHIAVAKQLDKPLVIEEFGLPRDGHVYDPASATTLRDAYYDRIFSVWKQQAATNGPLAGASFWAFNGKARPIPGQTFWKNGDNYMGDPPMEEQGLNGVFDSDASTWKLIYSYTSQNQSAAYGGGPSDAQATPATVNLYRHLHQLLSKGVMFGHQDDLAYGVGWKYATGRSDVLESAGDYPAVYGWELGNIEHGLPYDLDSVPYDRMRGFIQQAYARGGVITISWHGDNPVNGESAWDTTHGAVAAILPGGAKHELYKSWLDKIAVFLGSLKTKEGTPIPVLFRPFHEFTGNWFWWCQNTCTPNEFKLLWRFTVDYLKVEKGLHQLLYVYNTADFRTKEDFLQRYPGDDVVDVVSFDSYQYSEPQKDTSFAHQLDQRLGILDEVALEHNKIPALAETGYEAIPYAQWWTRTLWPALSRHRVSYVLVWRNHGQQANGHMHYYAPYKGQASAADFKTFHDLPGTLFEKDVAKENLYNK